MLVKIKSRIFVEDKDYFVDEKGHKYTRLGFDDIKDVCLGSYYYRLGKKINIVSRVFVQMHKHRQDYIQSAIYDYLLEFPTFYVLMRADDEYGVKIVFKNDKQYIHETGKLVFCDNDRYAVIVTDNKTVVYYSSNDGTEYITLTNLETDFDAVKCDKKMVKSTAYVFDFVGNLKNSILQISNYNELKQILNLFKLFLNEDVANFNQKTKKYVLCDKNDCSSAINLDKDINE